MAIILNENDWAQDMIEKKSLGDKPFETLRRAARYYMDSGYSQRDTRNLIEKFLLQCSPEASPASWMDTLDRAVSVAAKRPAVNIGSIVITKPEMETIGALNGTQPKRLAFTLLCLSKYINAVNPDMNGWVCTDDREIMKLTNMKASMRRESAVYRMLRDAGLIQFSKKIDNTNVRVLFSQDGEEALRITDFRALGNQYAAASGGKNYYICENCGIVARSGPPAAKGGRPKKYCPRCADLLYRRWTPDMQGA